MIPAPIRFWAKVDKSAGDGGCWVWTARRNARGYGEFTVHDKLPRRRAHQYSYELAHGSIPAGLWVLHHCDNPPCVNPAHLYAGTARDNSLDMVRRGRGGIQVKPECRARGSRHGSAKLTEAEVLEIRRLRAEGYSKDRLAIRYAISDGTIADILAGRTWTHLLTAPAADGRGGDGT